QGVPPPEASEITAEPLDDLRRRFSVLGRPARGWRASGSTADDVPVDVLEIERERIEQTGVENSARLGEFGRRLQQRPGADLPTAEHERGRCGHRQTLAPRPLGRDSPQREETARG